MRYPMPHLARALVLSTVAVTLAACRGTTAPDRELRAAQVLWNQRGPASYDITVSLSCECTNEMTGPVVVSVRDGLVTSRTYVSTGATVGLSYAEHFLTVEGLFRKIDDARSRNPASLEVRYDPAFGFPSLISIDYNRQYADDEIVYRAYDFHER